MQNSSGWPARMQAKLWIY